MNDLISRLAAIEAVEELTKWYYNTLHETRPTCTAVVAKLLDLPSAQPEPYEGTVSRQRLLSDLKELVAAWKKYPVMAKQIKGVEAAIEYVETIPSAQPEPCKDAVSRAEIIRLILERGLYCDTQADRETSAEIIRQLPSVKPERKKGEWILVKGSNCKDYHKCSECLHTQDITGVKNYCAVCGAQMDAEGEE